jgi:hypothetical protein
MNKKHTAHRCVVRVPIVLALAALTAPTYSANFQWIGSDGGDFLTDSNWNPGAVPGSADNFLLTTDNDPQTVFLNGAVSVLGGLIENIGGGSMTLEFSAGTFDIGTDPNGSLVVGGTGDGAVNMTGGTLNILNNDVNTAAAFVLGDQTGAVGTFTQSGGNVEGGRALAIGLNGGSGTYNLNTDTVNGSTPTLNVGFIALGNNTGQGTFNQQADTASIAGSLFVGSQGTYNLGGGSLDTTGVGIGEGTIVGTSGNGAQLNQTGGTHTANDLVVGNRSDGAGTYDISGGDLEVNGRMFIGLGHDSLPATGSINGLFKQSAGNVDAAQIFIGGFTDVIPDPVDPVNNPPTVNSYFGRGRYELSDGLVGSTFTVVGKSGNGTVLQTGGTFNAGELQLGSDGLFATDNGSGYDFYSSGVYDLQGGRLNTSGTTVSGFGVGTFNQSGTSEHDVLRNLVVGSQPAQIEPNSLQPREGVYELKDSAMLSVGGNTVIGAGNGVDLDPGFDGEPGARGTFTQSGGVHEVDGNLIVGQSGNVKGGTGFYNLSAGSATVAGNTTIGGSGLPDGLLDGTGTFNHTGGTFTTIGDMTVGIGVGTGTYNLSDTAILNTGITYLGAPGGTFDQDGGDHNTGNLNIYGGEYKLHSGTVDVAANMGVGYLFNSASFTQTGGAVNVNDAVFGLTVGGDAANGTTGTYTLDDGTLTVAATTRVGSNGAGTFNQNGGTQTTDHLILGESAVGNGTYNLTGGVLNDDAIVGDAGVGVFDNSGGTHNVTGDLILGNQATGDGTYNLSGTGITAVTGSMTVGKEGTGAVTLADTAELSTDNRLTVGAAGNGSVLQEDTSSVTVGGLRVGEGLGSTSSYTMNSGTLDVLSTEGVNGGARVGLAGTGTFTQNGGTFNTRFMQIGGTTFGQGGGGDGTVDLNGGSLVASGSIAVNADGASTGVLNVAGGSLTAATVFNGDRLDYSAGSLATTVHNNAAFNVSGGAARTLTGTLNNNTGGTTTVAVGTPLTISGALNQGAGASIVANADITVGTDYTNASAGSGNAFDRRAGVSGGGQILGNNAAQTIAGNVAAAGANAWTLDLGNVRGSSGPVTKNYQIGNSGTGADIRGAIQTAELGNITDARLSGLGVTAGNFGPIVAGANSGNLAVTFSGAAGTALSGQKVAVVSNFDNVATQVIDITGGAVSALAVGNATPNTPQPINLGAFRISVGPNPSQGFAVTNTTSGAGAEQLGIASAAATGNFSASNNLGLGLIAGGATANDAVTVQVSGGLAGVNNGNVAIQYLTNGTAIDPTFTSQNANLQNVALQATGYRLAVATIDNPQPVVLYGRVGDTVGQGLSLSNTAAADGFSEGLGVASSTATGGALLSGTVFGLIAAGATNTDLTVGLDTGTSGLKTGTVQLGLVSDGAGTSGLAAVALPGDTVQLQGSVYAAAVADLQTPTVDFGIARVGDTVATQNVALGNSATGPLTDVLRGGFASVDTPFTGLGDLGTGVAAGEVDSTSLNVGVSTATAGVLRGSAQLDLVSHNDDMADLDLAPVALDLTAQVNALASPVYQKAGGFGTLSGSGSLFTLDLGSIVEGSAGLLGAALNLLNLQVVTADLVTGIVAQDNLAGTFDATGNGLFGFANFMDFIGLAAAADLTDLLVGFDPTGLGVGTYTGEMVLAATSTYDGLDDYSLGDVRLRVIASIVGQGDVPEPAIVLLLLPASTSLLWLRRRRRTGVGRG